MTSLLNKLATQYYDLSPLEFDQRRTVNPEYVKKLQINKAWYLSQVKSRCRSGDQGPEIAQLLSLLESGDLAEVLRMKDFHPPILQECILWCIEQGSSADTALFKSTVEVVLMGVRELRALFPKPHQVSTYCNNILPRDSSTVQGLNCFNQTHLAIFYLGEI